jgi:hypothetical protein
MASPLPTDPDTIAITSTASGIAPSDLVVAIATVQAAVAASRECVVAVEAVSQQEHAAMAAPATTSGAATAPTDLVATFAALQVRVATTEVKAQQA